MHQAVDDLFYQRNKHRRAWHWIFSYSHLVISHEIYLASLSTQPEKNFRLRKVLTMYSITDLPQTSWRIITGSDGVKRLQDLRPLRKNEYSNTIWEICLGTVVRDCVKCAKNAWSSQWKPLQYCRVVLMLVQLGRRCQNIVCLCVGWHYGEELCAVHGIGDGEFILNFCVHVDPYHELLAYYGMWGSVLQHGRSLGCHDHHIVMECDVINWE